ncbi:MAG: hypothetical protein PUC06_11730, partial [Oscillospiraceae bacterium]|nr:hypothetical protein [Oscillospiraceae bacterium]
AQLKEQFCDYQTSLGLEGLGGFGKITGDNLRKYLMDTYLIPEATRYIRALPAGEQQAYLTEKPWISFDGETASFTFEDYMNDKGRMKGLPAFDDFDKAMAEPDLFGTETVKSRHFTQFSLEHDPNETETEISEELKVVINMMNPMYFALNNNPGCAPHWWIRHGAIDRDTSLPIVTNMATALENIGKDVNARLVWEGGHCADDDPEGLMAWMKAMSE